MGYGAIIRHAWDVTWRYKILWLFGLFAGTAGSSSSSSSYRTDTTTVSTMSLSEFRMKANEVILMLQPYRDLILIGLVLAIVLGFLGYLLTAVARGALIHLVNEAEEGHEVRAGLGWRAGFSKMWRVFGVDFITGLPMLVPLALMVGSIWYAAARFFAILGESSSWQVVGMRTLQDVGFTVIGLTALAGVLALLLGLMFAVVSAMALRFAVIEDRGVIDSIRQGWRALWAGKGAFVMFLVLILVGFAFSIVMAMVGGILAGPMVSISTDGVIRMTQSPAAGLTFLLLLPAAIYGAFYHAVWTVFFRRYTGRGTQPVMATPATQPPMMASEMPIPPTPEVPAAPQPPAPPASDA